MQMWFVRWQMLIFFFKINYFGMFPFDVSVINCLYTRIFKILETTDLMKLTPDELFSIFKSVHILRVYISMYMHVIYMFIYVMQNKHNYEHMLCKAFYSFLEITSHYYPYFLNFRILSLIVILNNLLYIS